MVIAQGLYWTADFGEIAEAEQFRVGSVGEEIYDAYFPINQLQDLITSLTNVTPLGLNVLSLGTQVQSKKVNAGFHTDVVIEPRSDTFPPPIMRFELAALADLISVLTSLQTLIAGQEPSDWNNDSKYTFPPSSLPAYLQPAQLNSTFGEQASMLAYGAAADGATNDWVAFKAARTAAGAKGVVVWRAKPGVTETVYFIDAGGDGDTSGRFSLSGTQNLFEPGVKLRGNPAPDVKTWGILSPVTLDHTAFGTVTRRPQALDIPTSTAIAAGALPQPLSVVPVDLTTWTQWVSADAVIGTVTDNLLSWASAPATSAVHTILTPAEVGKTYEACVETTSLDSTTVWMGPFVTSIDNEYAALQLKPGQLILNWNGAAAFTGSGSVFSHTVTGLHGLPPSSGGAIASVRIVSLRKAEFYVNGKLIRTQTFLKDIAKVGFGGNNLALNTKTVHNAVVLSSDFKPKNAGQVKTTIIGDSISFSAWNAQTYGDLLNVAFAALPGGGKIDVVSNLAVSGTLSGDWVAGSGGAPAISTLSFAGLDYVNVMLGTNDGQTLVPVSTYISNMTTIANKIVADGAVPVFGVFPLWVSAGISGVTGANPANAGKASRLRAALMRWAATNGYPLAMVADSLGGGWRYLPDNIHPDANGQALVAVAFAQAIARHRAAT